jgi:hypothetical protein
VQLAGDTQNVDFSWCEHASGAGELLLLLLVLHAVICSFAGHVIPDSGTRTAAICSSLDFSLAIFNFDCAVTARTRHSDATWAATQCASLKCSLHLRANCESPTT